MDRATPNIRKIVKDVENVSGKLDWVGKTHLTDDFHPLYDEGISKFVITEPENYMTKKQWEEQQAEALELETKLLRIKSIRAPKRDFDGGHELFMENPLDYIRKQNGNLEYF